MLKRAAPCVPKSTKNIGKQKSEIDIVFGRFYDIILKQLFYRRIGINVYEDFLFLAIRSSK